MARTTVDIDTPILDELRRLQGVEETTLGRLISDLLAQALADRASRTAASGPSFRWGSQSMGPRVDLEDKDALGALLDGDGDGDGGEQAGD